MTRPKVSVIIPVYNAGCYIRQCIESLQNQSVKDIEIVAVDDASTDDSAEVVSAMAMADHRMKFIHKADNEGSMMARDTGFKAASGEFFFFIDADDFIPADTLEILLDEQARSGADVVVGDFELVRADGHRFRMNRHHRLSDKPEDYMRAILTGLTNSLCGSLFSRRLFDDFTYTAEKHLLFYDDRIVLTEMLLNLRPKIATVDEVTYCYRINPVSMTRSRYSDERFRMLIETMFRCWVYVDSIAPEFKAYNDRFIIKNLCFYIEEGYDRNLIMTFRPQISQLLSYESIRSHLGMAFASHIALCLRSRSYQKAVRWLKHFVWRLRGKE